MTAVYLVAVHAYAGADRIEVQHWHAATDSRAEAEALVQRRVGEAAAVDARRPEPWDAYQLGLKPRQVIRYG